MNNKQEIHEERITWAQFQARIQNSVVQVVSQVAVFNWCEPYRITEQQEVRGTGFFIDNDGHFITNAHVVNQAKTIWIHLPRFGKKLLFAQVVGFCPERDLALLRLDQHARSFLKQQSSDIVPLILGNSDTAQCTDLVFVFGYPLGQYGMKSSTGVISGRESGEGRTLIQISAAVNPGNSGGPLFNERGQVIGIAVYTVPSAQNIGYAIPINELHVVIDELYSQRLVRKALLGMQFNYASDEHAQLCKNPLPAGCYINKVFKGSLLDQAGVKPGDMLYELNGFRFDMFGEIAVPWNVEKITIYDLVSRLKIGEKIDLVIYRNGERLTFSINFELTRLYPIRFMYPEYEEIPYEVVGGMVVMQLADNHIPLLAPLSPRLLQYTEIENQGESRLVISHIIPGSVVQESRCFESGDIITHVNSVAVKEINDLVQAIFNNQAHLSLLTIKTEDDSFGVFSLKKIKDDENRLSRDFAYPVSSIGRWLLENNQL